jgi:hypothetical protein
MWPAVFWIMHFSVWKELVWIRRRLPCFISGCFHRLCRCGLLDYANQRIGWPAKCIILDLQNCYLVQSPSNQIHRMPRSSHTIWRSQYYWTTWKRSRNSLNRNRNRKRRDTPAPRGGFLCTDKLNVDVQENKNGKVRAPFMKTFLVFNGHTSRLKRIKVRQKWYQFRVLLKNFPMLFFQSSPLWSRVTTGQQQDVENYMGFISERIVSRDDLKMTETREVW